MDDACFSSVEEVTEEIVPVINSGSLRVYDDKNQRLYVYGGIRWPTDENDYSPTLRPTADFHVFRSHPHPKWEQYSTHMRWDESFVSPFEERLSRPDTLDLTLPKLGSLPVLLNPIGAVVHDETSSKTSYLLVLGDPFGKDLTNYRHPVLICINLNLNTWRYIKLKNSEKVVCGRMYGSMIVSGQLRVPGADTFLCVFGGVSEEADTFTYTYLDTFAVANLSKTAWITPNGNIPRSIGPLGIRPSLAKYLCEQNARELILILGGAVEHQPLTKKTIARTRTNSSRGFLFDPRTRIHQFVTVENDPNSQGPGPAITHFLQRPRTLDYSCVEFLVVTCGRQRPFNKFPRRPDSTARLQRLYKKPKVKIWIATIREPESKHDSRSVGQQDLPGSGLNTDSEESSSVDDFSSDSESSVKQGNVTDALAQRAIKPSREVKPSGKIMTWRNIAGGRVKDSLNHLTSSFRIEIIFLRGELSTDTEPCEYSNTHQLSPHLVLLGCDHKYLGEIRADVFNAFAGIPLRSICEAEDDDSESDSLSDHGEDVTSSESTHENGESDDEMLSYEAAGLDLDGSENGDIGENLMPDTPDRGTPNQSESGAFDFISDDASDVIDTDEGRDPSRNNYHLTSDAEVGLIPMDFEIEALVEDLMDTYTDPPGDEETVGSVWSDGYAMDTDANLSLASPAPSISEPEM